MTRKHDPITNEEFDCTGDTGHCWCFAVPPLGLPLEGDCKGPKHLEKLRNARQAASEPADK